MNRTGEDPVPDPTRSDSNDSAGSREASDRMAYSVSQTDQYIEVRFSGATSVEELIQLVAELIRGRTAYAPICLVDLTDLERSDIDYAAVTRIFDYRESLSEHERGSRIAIVASEPHLFGMGRMIELRTSAHARTVRAFHTAEEAKAWLVGA